MKEWKFASIKQLFGDSDLWIRERMHHLKNQCCLGLDYCDHVESGLSASWFSDFSKEIST
jgi:hypothetical protein